MPKIIEKETKQTALERLVRGDDIDEITRDLGVSEQSIKNWLKKAKEESYLSQEHIGIKPSEKKQQEAIPGQIEGIVHQLQKHPESDMYSTRILQEAAALSMNGHEIEKITQGQDFKKAFHFKRTGELERILARYWSGDLTGSLCEFNNKVWELSGKRV